jgi:MFS family permease
MTVTTSTARQARRRSGLLRQHDFRLLWIGESTSGLGSSVTSVALPLVAVTTLHASAFAVSLLSAAAWLPWLLIGLPAGAWVDRLTRRPVMLACDIVSAALFLSIPLAAMVGVLTIAQLLAVALTTGVANVFFSTAYRAYLPSLVQTEDLLEGNAKLQGSASATQVAGPGAAGLIAQVFGAAGGMLVDAASFVVSAACLWRIRARETPFAASRRRLSVEIVEGLEFVRRDAYLRTFMMFGGAANLLLTGYHAIVIVFLIRTVGLSSGGVGLLLAGSSLGGVLGALLARRVAARFGTARGMLVCKVGAAPFGLGVAMAGHGVGIVLALGGGAVLVGGIVAGNVISGGFIQAYCPSGIYGRVSTSMQVVNFGTMPLGAVLGGVLAGQIGLRPTMWLMLSLFVLSTVILLASPVRALRDLPSRPQSDRTSAAPHT